jgi:hypothetical protein
VRVTIQEGVAGAPFVLGADDGRVRFLGSLEAVDIARHVGFDPCPHCSPLAGVVGCEHREATEVAREAREYLNGHIGESFRVRGVDFSFVGSDAP